MHTARQTARQAHIHKLTYRQTDIFHRKACREENAGPVALQSSGHEAYRGPHDRVHPALPWGGRGEVGRGRERGPSLGSSSEIRVALDWALNMRDS